MKRTADSFEELVQLLEADPRLNTITISAHEEAVGFYSHHPVIGAAANHRMGILYVATGRWGRKATCLEELMTRLRTARGFHEDSPLQRRDTLVCFITADRRMQELAARFPDRAVTLVQADGPVDSELLKELREEAAELDIVPISP